MIKAPYTVLELDGMAKSFLKMVQKNFDIEARIGQWILNNAGHLILPVMNYIQLNFTSIVSGRPNELDMHKGQLDPLVAAAKAAYQVAHPGSGKHIINGWFNKTLFPFFNYDFDAQSFTKRENGRLAYHHAQRLNLNTCLYCNGQFTYTIWKPTRKLRPQFDHFYNKGKQPYFALSFYNLIPCCPSCNSSLKGVKEFMHATHLHPFLDSMEGVFTFRSEIDAVDFLTGKKDFKIKMVPCKGASVVAKGRSKNNIAAFGLIDRYNWHKDYAGEVIKKAYMYTHTTIYELLKDFEVEPGTNLFSSEAEIKELIVGNYLDEGKFHRRILSKLTRDIADEFGMRL